MGRHRTAERILQLPTAGPPTPAPPPSLVPGLWILLGAAIGGACLLAALHQCLWVRKVRTTPWFQRQQARAQLVGDFLAGGVGSLGLANRPEGEHGGKALDLELQASASRREMADDTLRPRPSA